MKISINADSSKELNNKLKKLNNSAYPKAIRETLNNGAFTMKKKTIIEEGKKAFITREKDFLKANTRYKSAKGNNVLSMEAKFEAFQKSSPKASKSGDEIKDLDVQDVGGKIANRQFVPLNNARGGSYQKKVKLKYLHEKIKDNIVDSDENKHGEGRQRFVRSVIYGQRKYGDKNFFILSNLRNGRQTLSLVNKVTKKDRGISIKRTALFHVYKSAKVVSINKTGFRIRAAKEANLQMSGYFIEKATKIFEKIMS